MIGRWVLLVMIPTVSILVTGGGCGGKERYPDCGPTGVYCIASDVCCPEGYYCGSGSNGCPSGGCCRR